MILVNNTPAYFRAVEQDNVVYYAAIRRMTTGSDWYYCLRLAPPYKSVVADFQDKRWLDNMERIPMTNVPFPDFKDEVNTAFYGSAQAA